MPIRNLTVGTAPGLGATLRVRGDQMAVDDAFETSRCTFRSDVPNGYNQNWSMERGGIEMGRLFSTNPGNAFVIQARHSLGALRLRNGSKDGIYLIQNDLSSATINGYHIDRIGFGAIGSDAGMLALEPNAPWSRWHLVHPTQGSQPYFGYRPWMRNGVTGTGNSDLFYIGHKYEINAGTGAEVNDNSDVVAVWGDDALPTGAAHKFDNFSFRYVGSPGLAGSAGTDDGLEIMRLRPYRAVANGSIQGYVGLGDWGIG